MTNWTPKDTTTHQDHVIAHVLGASFLGYFVFEEALYVLLDIGFIWMIFLDGEMGLLPHPVAVNELEVDPETKQQIKSDVDVLLGDGAAESLFRFRLPPLPCQIQDVTFFAGGTGRRLLIAGDEANLIIETSLETAEIQVMPLENELDKDLAGAAEPNKLEDVAQTEHEYLHQRLREDLGREPTEEELDEWLRQHTEGY